MNELQNLQKGIDPESLNLPKLLAANELSTWRINNALEGKSFLEIEERREKLEILMEEYASGHKFKLSEMLTQILDHWVNKSKLDAFIIATEDGLIVSSNHSGEGAEHTATLAAMFESVVQRIESGGIVSDVQEITLRGGNGELIIVRDFVGLNRRFFLLGCASRQVSYRFVTNQILKAATILLSGYFD